MSPNPQNRSKGPMPAIMRPPKKEEPKITPPPPIERYAEVGDVVEWYPGADPTTKPQPAVITSVGSDGIVVANVMNCEIRDTIPQDGCYHMDHPKARQMGPQEGGGWRHKPLVVATRGMFISLGLLEWNSRAELVQTQKCRDVAGGVISILPEPKDPVAPAAA